MCDICKILFIYWDAILGEALEAFYDKFTAQAARLELGHLDEKSVSDLFISMRNVRLHNTFFLNAST